MLTILRRLLWDEIYAEQWLRGGMQMLGTLFIAGAITMNDLGDQFGKAGWWIGLFLHGAAGFVRAGQRNEAPK